MAGKPRKPLKFDQNATAQQVADRMVQRLGAEFQMDNVDRAIIGLMNQYPSITQTQIAEALGYSRTSITHRVNRTAFKQAMAEIQKGVAELLIDVQIKALKKIRLLLESSNDEVVLGAAKLALAPLAKAEQAGTVNHNMVYAVQFGEGGQLFRDTRLMKPAEQFIDSAELLSQ